MPTPLRRRPTVVGADGVHRLQSGRKAELLDTVRSQRKGVRARTLDSRTLLLIACATDLSASSRELAAAVENDAEDRRLAPSRANLVRLLDVPTSSSVLEVGAGAGTLTRYLGETCGPVDAIEADPVLARAAAARCAELPNVRVFQGNWATSVPGASDRNADGYDLILLTPDWADFTGRPFVGGRRVSELAGAQAGIAGLTRLLTADGRLVIAVPRRTGYRAAGQRHALISALESAGLTVEEVLTATPDHVRTRTLVADSLPPEAVARLVRQPEAGSVVLIARKPSASPAGTLFDDQLRSTSIDGRRLQAGRLTLRGAPDDLTAIRQVQRLDRPGAIRVNGGAQPWFSGETLLELWQHGPTAEALDLLESWGALVRDADFSDGAPVTLIPRFLGVTDSGGLLRIGPEVLADGWTVSDVLGHGMLDALLHRPAHGLMRGEYLEWATLVGLGADWVARAVTRGRELAVAVHGDTVAFDEDLRRAGF